MTPRWSLSTGAISRMATQSCPAPTELRRRRRARSRTDVGISALSSQSPPLVQPLFGRKTLAQHRSAFLRLGGCWHEPLEAPPPPRTAQRWPGIRQSTCILRGALHQEPAQPPSPIIFTHRETQQTPHTAMLVSPRRRGGCVALSPGFTSRRGSRVAVKPSAGRGAAGRPFFGASGRVVQTTCAP